MLLSSSFALRKNKEKGDGMEKTLQALQEMETLLQKHETYRQQCLNLIASENYASPRVRQYQTSDFGNRYGCHETLALEKREYTGNRYIYEFEAYLEELLTSVYGGQFVDLRPVSGHMAGMAVVTGLLPAGGTMMEVSWDDWGHGLAEAMVGNPHFQKTIHISYLPFQPDRTIDLATLEKMLQQDAPQLLVMGASGMLWREPVAAVKQLLSGKDTILAYDISHISGLIACGVYPNPLAEGADIIFGSTHKSFPGPQGGFIVTNRRELAEKVGNALSPCMVTSHHLQRLPALAAALLEMKAYGPAYGQKIIKNSQALGQALVEVGFPVIGKAGVYSETHQVLVHTEPWGTAEEINIRLEAANILCSGFCVPVYDLRIGTQELTRRGMVEKDAPEIAQLLARAILHQEAPESLKPDVIKMASRFQQLQFAFSN